jgi:hypothetical protein
MYQPSSDVLSKKMSNFTLNPNASIAKHIWWGSVHFLNKGILHVKRVFFPLPKKAKYGTFASIEFSTKNSAKHQSGRVRFPIQHTIYTTCRLRREFQIFKFWRASEVECTHSIILVYPSCKKNTHNVQNHNNKNCMKERFLCSKYSNQKRSVLPTYKTKLQRQCIHNSKNSLAWLSL